MDNKTIATVFVPEGKLTYFLNKITQYQEQNTSWWEVWFRRSSKIDFEAFLRDHANQLQMKLLIASFGSV